MLTTTIGVQPGIGLQSITVLPRPHQLHRFPVHRLGDASWLMICLSRRMRPLREPHLGHGRVTQTLSRPPVPLQMQCFLDPIMGCPQVGKNASRRKEGPTLLITIPAQLHGLIHAGELDFWSRLGQ